MEKVDNPISIPNVSEETEDKASVIAFHSNVLSFAEAGIGSFFTCIPYSFSWTTSFFESNLHPHSSIVHVFAKEKGISTVDRFSNRSEHQVSVSDGKKNHTHACSFHAGTPLQLWNLFVRKPSTRSFNRRCFFPLFGPLSNLYSSIISSLERVYSMRSPM